MNYKKAYFALFNAISDAIYYLDKQSPATAAVVLGKAQQEAEDSIISQPSREDEVREEDEIPEGSTPPQ